MYIECNYCSVLSEVQKYVVCTCHALPICDKCLEDYKDREDIEEIEDVVHDTEMICTKCNDNIWMG
jgi:hypothetical protein